MPRRQRLDAELVRRGLARSRDHAASLVHDGRVLVAGRVAEKPATAVTTDIALVVSEDAEGDDFVSRGGHKLAAVLAVDVGYGQLAWSLRQDPRVEVIDRTNVRQLTLDRIGDPVDLVTCDLSFISIRLVLPALTSVCELHGDLVLMVKPQFEVGRERLGKG